MFGGLMVNTYMACGIVHDDLMVRVGRDGHETAIGRGAREMDFTGRPMRGMVIVPGADVREESALHSWVGIAVNFARSEAAKRPSAREKE